MLELRPITYEEAARYVDENHRHHKRPVGHKFSIAVYENSRLSRTFCSATAIGIVFAHKKPTKNGHSVPERMMFRLEKENLPSAYRRTEAAGRG